MVKNSESTGDPELDELLRQEAEERGEPEAGDKFVRAMEFQAQESAMEARGLHPEWMPTVTSEKTHAWGKQQPAGSVALPPGFEGVAGLGAPLVVCMPRGMAVPHIGALHASALVAYEEGLAFQAGGKDVQVWRHNEVAFIQSKIVDHRGGQSHEFRLVKTTGEVLFVDDAVHIPVAAIDQIKYGVFKLLVDGYVEHYERNEVITLGPVAVQKQGGMQISGRKYSWEDIQNVEVMTGQLKVVLANNKKAEVNTCDIPNIELLGRLIGLSQPAVNLGLISYY